MAITGIEQADILEIDKQVRLRRYDGQHDFSFEWHQDLELVWLIDGDQERYSLDLLNRMYDYLSKNGECYFIEIFEANQFIPIGDVTLFADDFAIAIGDKRYWKKGIGTKVLQRMIERAREVGLEEIPVEEIYDWNTGPRKLFEKCGFEAVEKTKKGWSYKMIL
ncbi:GNAT family N-acetyltransferase [Streptococcus suis]|uniref:GNAT family N-acetyltransferase n=1 Tax=Streptococcus suis TaxID=1307 RepID=UPI0005CCA784|nr:GNAT family N-acetyltransferase [Streptococcus suis]NQH45166.1 GNAT family N-acetyltransferase [Streptococcus suis]NQH57617.1 GNAT family N-acetyltransferase [Streptococcus suis]NQP96739.1 GNAT family N-acetyltransferase [Streptococcus suis]CYU37755.1 histone acetyltransferase HPA2-like acetyltransferase [Streptococcus suis]CYU62857.1 histone acetyltransferase HPA2-like acetyltransferase [Streptococcus suis]